MKNDTDYITLQAAEAIAEFLAVTVDSDGKAALTAVNGRPIGHAIRTAATGDFVTIFVGKGKHEAIANEAILKGALVYGAAAGKVTDTAGTQAPHGICTKAAAADGDKFEYVTLL